MVDLILFVAVVFVLSRLFQLDRVVTELSEREHRLQREVDRLAARLKVAAAAPDAVARAATDLAPDQARLRAEPPDARVAPQPSAAAPPVHPLPAAALPHEPTPAAPPSPPPATPPAPSVPTPLPARAEPTPPISPTAPTPRRVPPGAPSVRPAPPPRPAPTAQPAPAVRAEGTALVTPRAQPSSARPRPQRPQAAAARSWFGGGAALEELLGVRLYVWIGAVALALAGALLVKYTIDRGVLTPTMRIALGVAFGLALLGAGERLRRGTARIAAALSAAGVAVLFASFYAGSTVYEIVPAAVGFVLMALTAGTGVFLSLRHGPGVAAVGLMGGFLTPALVSSEAEPQAAPLFIYLFLLQAAMTQVARRRGWWAMTALSVVAGLAWFGAWLAGTFQPGDAFWLQVYLVAATGNLVAAARRGDAGGDADAADAPKHAPAWMPVASAFATLLLSAVVVHLSGYTWHDWAVVALLGGATLLLGRMARVYESLSWVAAAVTGTSLLAWGVQGRDAEALTIPLLARSVHPFLLAAGLFGALYAVGAYANVWRSRRPVVWAGLSAVSVLWFYGIAFFGHSIIRFTISSPFGVAREWGGVGLVLAAVVVAAAVPLLRRRTTLLEGATVATAPLACAAVLFALGSALAASESSTKAAWSLDAVAWALDVLAVVWAAWRFGLPLLRRLAWPLGALVAGALLTPIVALVEWGTHPLFTWLIVAYGPPAGAFAVAAWVARRDGARRLSTALQWGAVALGLVGSTLMVRQWFHPGDLLGGGCLLAESGTYAALWLAVGTALVVASRRWAIDVAAQGGRAIVALGIGGAFAGPMLLANPLRTDVLVGGWPVLNGLLYPFILPAVLAVLVARVVHDPDRPFLGRAATATWLALATVLVGLEVRHGFHVGTPLRSGALGLVEAATYPIAWMGLGLILLRVRDRFPRDVPEIGALSVIALGLAAVAAPVALVNPLSDAEAVGRWPVANWLLYAYGVPAAIAAVVARKVRDTGSRALAGAATVTWLALITLLVGLDVRHAFDRTALLQGISDLIEAATYPIAWLVLGLVLLRARPRFPRDVPELGGPAVVLLGLVACLCQPVATWLLWSKDAIGSWPVLNGLLYAYGVPAALAIVAARELRRIGVPDVAAAARATWLILVTAFVAFEVRHAFEGVLPPHAATVRLVESATYAIVWMVLGLVLMRLRSRFPEDVPAKGPEAVVTLGLVAVAGPLVVLNPLWEHIAVGTQRLLNVLPYVYGLPAALAVLAARELRRAGADVWLSRAAGGLGVGLGFVLVNLLVRQGFHGTYLDTGPLSVPENYAYSLAWVLYGAALLVAGVAGGGRLVRWASLLVMLLAVGKVFLYDTANLRDLYRVVSFLGLGLSLIGLGWVYQRFVFRSEEAR